MADVDVVRGFPQCGSSSCAWAADLLTKRVLHRVARARLHLLRATACEQRVVTVTDSRRDPGDVGAPVARPTQCLPPSVTPSRS